MRLSRSSQYNHLVSFGFGGEHNRDCLRTQFTTDLRDTGRQTVVRSAFEVLPKITSYVRGWVRMTL